MFFYFQHRFQEPNLPTLVSDFVCWIILGVFKMAILALINSITYRALIWPNPWSNSGRGSAIMSDPCFRSLWDTCEWCLAWLRKRRDLFPASKDETRGVAGCVWNIQLPLSSSVSLAGRGGGSYFVVARKFGQYHVSPKSILFPNTNMADNTPSNTLRERPAMPGIPRQFCHVASHVYGYDL